METILDGEFIASFKVPERSKYPWEHVKHHLIREMQDKLIPAMLDSGNYHVVKLDMGSRKSYDDKRYEFFTEYFITARCSIAREERWVVMPILEPSYEVVRGIEKIKVDRVCLGCGNKLSLDYRGGCVACGTPNGGYK